MNGWIFIIKGELHVLEKNEPVSVKLRLNSRLTINEVTNTYQLPLKKNLPGIVVNDISSGGGAMRTPDNEILYVEVEVDVKAVDSSSKTLDVIIDKLNDIGVPAGSYNIPHKGIILSDKTPLLHFR